MCVHAMGGEGGQYSANNFITFFSSRPLLDITFFSVLPEYFPPQRSVFLSVGLSAPVPVLAEGGGGNDDIEGFSCHYVG